MVLTPDFPFVDVNCELQPELLSRTLTATQSRLWLIAILAVASLAAPARYRQVGNRGGGNLGPDVPYRFGQNDLGELATADINGDGWLDLMVRHINDNSDSCVSQQRRWHFSILRVVGLGGVYAGSFTLGDFNHDGKIDPAQIGCEPHNGEPPLSIGVLNIGLGHGTGMNFTQSQSIQLAGGLLQSAVCRYQW